MKTQVENISEVKKVIHFEIPWEDVDKHIHTTVHQISRSARIPGFRPGKAPETLIRSRFAQQIKEEIINHMVPEAYKQALDENKFDIISEPNLHDVMYSEGSPFLFKVTIEVRPKIELKQYKGIELKAEKFEVTEDEIQKMLKTYQEQAAELVPLTDTPAAAGHFLRAHVKAVLKGDEKKKPLFDNKTLIEIGAAENHPAFNEHLIGKNAGEVAEFDAEYPEDTKEKAIAGKTVHYHLDIESVNEKKVAALDDEFAKDLGDFASLEDLKEKIRKDIYNWKKSEQRSALGEGVVKELADKNPFEVPEGLVKKESENLLHQYAHTLQSRGVNLKNAKVDWAQIEQSLAHQAEQNIRVSLLINEIADVEKIEVTDEDLDKEIGRLADQRRRAPEAVKAELIKEEKMDSLKDRVRFSKTIDFLINNAVVTEVEPAPATEEKV